MPNSKKESAIFQEVRPTAFSCRRVLRNQRPKLECNAHLHNEIELILLEKGSAIAYADTVKVVMNCGDLFFAFPNQIHAFRTIDPTEEEHSLIIAKTELLPEYQGVFLHCTPLSPIIRNASSLPRVEKLFHMLIESEDERSLSREQANNRRSGYLLALISELLLHMDLHSDEQYESRSANAVLQYCAEHFSQRISLEQLGEELHLSRTHLSHLFNDKLGVSFKDHIHSLRIAEACRLLLNTSEEVVQISEAVGYSSPRTFNRAFFKQTGVSPTEYRKTRSAKTQIRHFVSTATTSRIIESADKVIKQ